MATITDQLATSIQQCFNQTYTDLANQQSFLFGSGDVTINKPDGSKGVVRSWSKLISQVDPVIKNAARVDQDTTFTKALNVTGIITSKADVIANKLGAQAIELSFSTPYIDFHQGNSTADYTHRLIAYDASTLTCTSHLRTEQNMQVGGWTDSVHTVRCYDSTAFLGMSTQDPQGGNGSILAGPSWSSRFPSRGSDSNGQAGFSAWMEEYVGYNHKGVFCLQGFGAQVKYWQFQSDGNVYGPNGVLSYNGTSDSRFKKQIKPTDGQQSLDNIMKMGLVTFVYIDDVQERVRRGVIAQQVQEIDPQYVKEVVISVGAGPETPAENVKTTSRLTLDNNVLLMDAISAIQVLARRVEELEKRNL